MLALNGLGFNAVLTLTEDRIDLRLLSELGIRSMHIPIANMHAPTIDQARRATNFLCECIYEDKQVFVDAVLVGLNLVDRLNPFNSSTTVLIFLGLLH